MINQFLVNRTFQIENKSHIITCGFLVLLFATYSILPNRTSVPVVYQSKNTFSVRIHTEKTSPSQISNPSETKQMTTDKIKKESSKIKSKSKNATVLSSEVSNKINELNNIFDNVEVISKPSNTVPMYDQIDYTKNAAELGIVLENSNVKLPKLQGEEKLEDSKNSPDLNQMPDVNAIANMLYNHLKEDNAYPEMPSDWVRKWQDVEGLVVVVGLLVDSEGNVIKTALIKSSGILKADTIVQYGLIGSKYDMSNELKKGQYKWLEIALSFNEDTF